MIKVFKTSNPDAPLNADAKQLREFEGKLIPWDQREAWLKKHGASGRPAKAGPSKQPEPEPESPNKGADGDEPPKAEPTKAELLQQAEDLGITVHKKMTVKQIKAAIAKKK